MLPCTVTEEMYMVLAVTTMLLLAKRKTGANFTWTFHQDHPPQGKYLLLCHHPHMNQMTSTPLSMDRKCCLTSAVNQMHQCTIYPLHSNVFYSLWNYLKTWTMSKWPKSLTTLMGTTVTQLKYTVENGTKHKKMEDGFWCTLQLWDIATWWGKVGNAWVHLYATMTTAPSLPQGKAATHMHLPTSDSTCMSVKHMEM